MRLDGGVLPTGSLWRWSDDALPAQPSVDMSWRLDAPLARSAGLRGRAPAPATARCEASGLLLLLLRAEADGTPRTEWAEGEVDGASLRSGWWWWWSVRIPPDRAVCGETLDAPSIMIDPRGNGRSDVAESRIEAYIRLDPPGFGRCICIAVYLGALSLNTHAVFARARSGSPRVPASPRKAKSTS